MFTMNRKLIAPSQPVVPTSPDQPVVADLIANVGGEAPIFVDVIPQPGCRVGECFRNVDALVCMYGGARISGWTIWIWPGYYARAEHHAVWERANGQVVDPTPKQDGLRKLLFVPDPKSVPTNDRFQIRRSKWMADDWHESASELVELCKKSESLWDEYARSWDEYTSEMFATVYEPLQAKIVEKELQMARLMRSKR